MEGVRGPDRDQEQSRGRGRGPAGGRHRDPDRRKRAKRSFQLEAAPRRDGCLAGLLKPLHENREGPLHDSQFSKARPWATHPSIHVGARYGFFSGAGFSGSEIFDFSMGPGFSKGQSRPGETSFRAGRAAIPEAGCPAAVRAKGAAGAVRTSGLASGSVRSFSTRSRSVGSDISAKASISAGLGSSSSTMAAISSAATIGGSADMTRAASIPRCQKRLASKKKSPSCASRQAIQT